MEDNFAVFILTHGRPDRVYTLQTLKRQGYTGRIYLVVDDEDTTLSDYQKRYGEMVVVFNKAAIAATFDTGDNFPDHRTIVYARNACFEIARGLGVEYFLELDDDYSNIHYRFNSRLDYINRQRRVLDLDRLFGAMLAFYRAIPALTISLSQGGDYVGGDSGGAAEGVKLKRKAMNSLFCSVHRPFTFVGRVNEDVNTYASEGLRGRLIAQTNQVALAQRQTQGNAGGMTELYLAEGTYIKSFYSVMYCPSGVSVVVMNAMKYPRLHHRVNWNTTVPKILAPEHRKA